MQIVQRIYSLVFQKTICQKINSDIFDHGMIENISKIESQKKGSNLKKNNNGILLQNQANFLSQGDNNNANNSTYLLLGFLKNNLPEHKSCDIFDHEIIENLSK